jgi:hypothetical protein
MPHIASSRFFWLGHLPSPKMHAVLYLQSVAQIIAWGGWAGGQRKLQQQQQQAVEHFFTSYAQPIIPNPCRWSVVLLTTVEKTAPD